MSSISFSIGFDTVVMVPSLMSGGRQVRIMRGFIGFHYEATWLVAQGCGLLSGPAKELRKFLSGRTILFGTRNADTLGTPDKFGPPGHLGR
jgi:hypothetical protein